MYFCTNRPLKGTLRGCTKMASDRCSKFRKWLNCAAYRTKFPRKMASVRAGNGKLAVRSRTISVPAGIRSAYTFLTNLLGIRSAYTFLTKSLAAECPDRRDQKSYIHRCEHSNDTHLRRNITYPGLAQNKPYSLKCTWGSRLQPISLSGKTDFGSVWR